MCLERRRKDLRATVDLLASADAAMVEKSVDMAHALPALHECEDVESLAEQQRRPADPALRGAIEGEERVVRAHHRGAVGQHRAALAPHVLGEDAAAQHHLAQARQHTAAADLRGPAAREAAAHHLHGAALHLHRRPAGVLEREGLEAHHRAGRVDDQQRHAVSAIEHRAGPSAHRGAAGQHHRSVGPVPASRHHHLGRRAELVLEVEEQAHAAASARTMVRSPKYLRNASKDMVKTPSSRPSAPNSVVPQGLRSVTVRSPPTSLTPSRE